MSELEIMMPESTGELCLALKESDEYTYLLSGGTDLMLKLRNHPSRFKKIIDLSGLKELQGIYIFNKNVIIGAMSTLTEISESKIVRESFPSLSMAAGAVGSTQIRNRGTFAGNVANSSPCADTATALLAYDARLKVVNGEGEIKWCSVDEIMVGMGKNSLNRDEAILECSLSIKANKSVSAFKKLGSRKAVSISKLNLCVAFEIDDELKIISSSVAVGSLGPKAFRCYELEGALRGRILNGDVYSVMTDFLTELVEKSIAGRSSMPYKRNAIKGLLQDALDDIFSSLELNGGEKNYDEKL